MTCLNVFMCHSGVFVCAFCVHVCVPETADKSVQSSAPAVSTDVVTPLLVSCCVFRGVPRSWMLSQYRGWGWWASGTDNTLITEWWTAGKLFFPPPPPTRQPAVNVAQWGRIGWGSFFTLKNILGWLNKENIFWKFEQVRTKGRKQEGRAKQRTFNKKCEFIFPTGVFFTYQLYLCLWCCSHPVLNFQWLFGYSQMSLAFFYSPSMVACGGKANILCVNSQHGTFRSI